SLLIGEHAGCRLIFADEQNREKASHVASKLGCTVVCLEQIRKPGQGTSNFPAPSRDDTAILIYTSGTTGNPKGVELTFNNLNHEIRGAIEFLQVVPE